MFTRLSSGIVGAILVAYGLIGLKEGKLDSFVRAVGLVSDWKATVELVSIIALGVAIIFRLSIASSWMNKKYARRHLYEIPMIVAALGFLLVGINSVIDGFS